MGEIDDGVTLHTLDSFIHYCGTMLSQPYSVWVSQQRLVLVSEDKIQAVMTLMPSESIPTIESMLDELPYESFDEVEALMRRFLIRQIKNRKLLSFAPWNNVDTQVAIVLHNDTKNRRCWINTDAFAKALRIKLTDLAENIRDTLGIESVFLGEPWMTN